MKRKGHISVLLGFILAGSIVLFLQTNLVKFSIKKQPKHVNLLDYIPFGDYNKLMDIPNFTFKEMNFICSNPAPFLLVLVHSPPQNFIQRRAIRDTWGQSNDNFKVLFMMGENSQEMVNSVLKKEMEMHKDIIQGNFLDTYYNLTYKHAMTLKYMWYHCKNAKFLLKTDDDVFVHIPNLLAILHSAYLHSTENFLHCARAKDTLVRRHYSSKQRVPYFLYSKKYFPHYCEGHAIVYGKDLVQLLYQELQNAKEYLYLDNVMVTGICYNNLGFSYFSTPMVLSNEMRNNILSGQINYEVYFELANPNLDENSIRGLWNYAKNYMRT